MDFFANFTLDEEFNETIRSRYRDTFSYMSFSEGEKMRIDLFASRVVRLPALRTAQILIYSSWMRCLIRHSTPQEPRSL